VHSLCTQSSFSFLIKFYLTYQKIIIITKSAEICDFRCCPLKDTFKKEAGGKKKNTSLKVEDDIDDISPFESGSSSTKESSCKLL
jgi:hypothetical protein